MKGDVFQPVLGPGKRVRLMIALTPGQKKAVENLAREHRLSASDFCQQAIVFALKSMGSNLDEGTP